MADLARYYTDMSDADLLTAHAQGRDAYRTDAWEIVVHELTRRELYPQSGSADSPEPTRRINEESRLAETGSNDARQGEPEIEAAKRQIRRGLIWFALGFAMTALSAMTADGGGYYLYYGAIVVGGYNLIRGNTRLEKARGIDPKTGKPAIGL